ncbi:hypothetical protein CYY_009629 [Polysphondylium violaceum]|uniref:Thioredoxin domain-containing protein n=1 Tax=Polysphondylium violaceum TaxID=133409 RepID=A0A8J4PLG4_9MYCE|nr:hypothetical protein CYY_009629 [Polysphondylium violaceum]
MSIIEIKSASQFDEELSTNELVIIYYTAKWCRAIGPAVRVLGEDNPSVIFLKVDIDLVSDHPLVKSVTSLPHFVSRKNGVEIEEFTGASPDNLKKMIAELVK